MTGSPGRRASAERGRCARRAGPRQPAAPARDHGRLAGLAVLAACALGSACGGASSSEPPPAAGDAPPVAREVPADVLLPVARRERPLASLVPAQEGVILVALTAAGDGAASERALRVCGAALEELVPVLEAHLVLALEGGAAPLCGGAWCLDAPLAEFDPARHFRFEEGPGGPRLAAVYLLDEAAVPEDRVAERRRRARAADAALAGAPCGASVPP